MAEAHEIVLDIKTVPVKEFSELSPDQQRYLIDRGGKGRNPNERLNISPLYGKIVALGIWLAREDKTCSMFEGEDNQWMNEIDIADTVFVGDEGAMLDAFWKITAKYPGRVITWNGRSFDVPFIYMRSAVNRVLPTRNIMGNRYNIRDHCDLMEIVAFNGATNISNYTLQAHAEAFGINHPGWNRKRSISETYREGMVEDIARYCMDDVRATAELYARLRPLLQVLYND